MISLKKGGSEELGVRNEFWSKENLKEKKQISKGCLKRKVIYGKNIRHKCINREIFR